MPGCVKKTLVERFWRKVRKTRGCWLWTGAIKKDNGYGVIGETRTGRMLYVHRVAWKLSKGFIPRGKRVLHKCDVRNCVRKKHLFVGTDADNTHDMYRKGRAPIGERHGCAKLHRSQVRKIRLLYARGGATQYELASRFGVVQTQIHHIVRRLSWKHVA
jgi:hypothetical protein